MTGREDSQAPSSSPSSSSSSRRSWSQSQSPSQLTGTASPSIPPSPFLQPQNHRPQPFQTTDQSSDSSEISFNPIREQYDNSTHSPSSSTSSSSPSAATSSSAAGPRRASLVGRPDIDMTSSIISTLDLDGVDQAYSPSAPATSSAESARLNGNGSLQSSEEPVSPSKMPSSLPIERMPLVREDTATREAIQSSPTELRRSSPSRGPDELEATSSHAAELEGLPSSSDVTDDSEAWKGMPSSGSPMASDGDESAVSPEPSRTEQSAGKMKEDDRDEQTVNGEAHSDALADEDDEIADPVPDEPKTTTSKHNLPETVPTVSATGLPRLVDRKTDNPQLQDQYSSSGPPPPELLPEDLGDYGKSHKRRQRRSFSIDSSSTTQSSSTSSLDTSSSYSTIIWPTSLTLSALSPTSALPFRRRLSILSTSLLINLGLPFINGAMLGFGEIFARTLIAPIVVTFVGRTWPSLATQRSGAAAGSGSAATAAAVAGVRQEGQKEDPSGRRGYARGGSSSGQGSIVEEEEVE